MWKWCGRYSVYSAGFPHDGFTFEDTMNYSVGFRGPTGRDLLSSFADYALEQDLGASIMATLT